MYTRKTMLEIINVFFPEAGERHFKRFEIAIK